MLLSTFTCLGTCHQHPSLELFMMLDFKIHSFIHSVIPVKSVAELLLWTRHWAGQSLAQSAFSDSPPSLTSPAWWALFLGVWAPKPSSLEKTQARGWGAVQLESRPCTIKDHPSHCVVESGHTKLVFAAPLCHICCVDSDMCPSPKASFVKWKQFILLRTCKIIRVW